MNYTGDGGHNHKNILLEQLKQLPDESTGNNGKILDQFSQIEQGLKRLAQTHLVKTETSLSPKTYKYESTGQEVLTFDRTEKLS